jgi:hypothetical protein
VDEICSFKFGDVYIKKKYVKDVFRDIIYHFNITQLKVLLLPTRDELELLKGGKYLWVIV